MLQNPPSQCLLCLQTSWTKFRSIYWIDIYIYIYVIYVSNALHAVEILTILVVMRRIWNVIWRKSFSSVNVWLYFAVLDYFHHCHCVKMWQYVPHAQKYLYRLFLFTLVLGFTCTFISSACCRKLPSWFETIFTVLLLVILYVHHSWALIILLL